MRVRVLLIAAVFVSAAGLVACSASPASTVPTTARATSPEAQASGTLAASPGAGESPVAGEDATASEDPAAGEDATASDDAATEEDTGSHVAPDLEAMLPGELSGTTLSKESQGGEAILDSFTQVMTAFLTGKGRTAADLQFAATYDATSSLDLSVYAFRVSGVAALDLKKALAEGLMAGSDLASSTATLSGRGVTKLTSTDETAATLYLYEQGEVVFVITTPDESLAILALDTLP